MAALKPTERRNAVLAQLADEVIAREDAAALERAQREEAARLSAERRAAVVAEIAATEGKRIEAVGRAEKAARDLSAALIDVLAHSAAIGSACVRAGVASPLALNGPSVERRFAERLCAMLSPVVKGRRRFGALDLLQPGRAAREAWAESETADVAGDLRLIMEGK